MFLNTLGIIVIVETKDAETYCVNAPIICENA